MAMYIKQYGEGNEVFVGLHGWGGTQATFAPVAARLPSGVVFFSADLPGYGKSAAPREWSLAAITDEVVEEIERLGVGGVTLVGNCSGAILAMLAAQRLGRAVRRLVLLDPFAFVPWYFDLFVSTRFGRYAYYSTFANPVGRWLTNLSLAARRAADSDLTASFTRVHHQTTYRYLQLFAAVGSFRQFGDLRLPIEILYGERTFRAVKESAVMYKSLWAQARLSELAGAGHLPIEEATAEVCERLFGETAMAAQPVVSQG